MCFFLPPYVESPFHKWHIMGNSTASFSISAFLFSYTLATAEKKN